MFQIETATEEIRLNQTNATKYSTGNECFGLPSKGIEITKGTAENKGIIEAKDGAIGVYVNGGNLTNSGKIIASGVNTDGVRIEKGNFTTDENSVIEVNGSDKLTSGIVTVTDKLLHKASLDSKEDVAIDVCNLMSSVNNQLTHDDTSSLYNIQFYGKKMNPFLLFR